MSKTVNRADQWRVMARAAAAEEAQELSLPSGMVVLARRPGAAWLAGRGEVPASLAGAVTQEPGTEISNEAVIGLATLVRDIVLYCVVDPVISLTPNDGEIHPSQIPDKDFTFIFRWATRGEEAARLETFRAQPKDGSAGGRGKDVGNPSVRTTRNKRRGSGS